MSRTIIPFPFFDIDITNFPFFGCKNDALVKKLNEELEKCKEKITLLETHVSQLSSQLSLQQKKLTDPPEYSEKNTVPTKPLAEPLHEPFSWTIT